jgi:hypothetical protein
MNTAQKINLGAILTFYFFKYIILILPRILVGLGNDLPVYRFESQQYFLKCCQWEEGISFRPG